MPTKSRLVFFGNERLATGVTTTTSTLQALLDAGYEVDAVVVQAATGRSRKSRPLEIADVAQTHGIPLLTSASWPEIEQQLRQAQPTAAVLVAYGKLVPEHIIDLFAAGITNLHPSLLPAYRGPTPIEQAILDGATQTGVSLMRLTKAMDTGPVYGQTTATLTGHESKQDLADRLLDLGAKLLIHHLPYILAGTAKPQPQAEPQASYTPLLTVASGQLDWFKPAAQLEREVRAYLGWPGSFTELAGQRIIVTEAAVTDNGASLEAGKMIVGDDKTIRVGTADGVFVIKRLKPAGRSEMSAADFVAGLGGRTAL